MLVNELLQSTQSGPMMWVGIECVHLYYLRANLAEGFVAQLGRRRPELRRMCLL